MDSKSHRSFLFRGFCAVSGIFVAKKNNLVGCYALTSEKIVDYVFVLKQMKQMTSVLHTSSLIHEIANVFNKQSFIYIFKRRVEICAIFISSRGVLESVQINGKEEFLIKYFQFFPSVRYCNTSASSLKQMS